MTMYGKASRCMARHPNVWQGIPMYGKASQCMARHPMTFRATHTKRDGLLESNSHNILQTHGKRTLGRMHNKETSKIYYTKPLLRSGWIGAGIETGEDDCAKKRNTIMDPWQSYDRANHCPTDKVMYTRKCTARELTCASGYRAA